MSVWTDGIARAIWQDRLARMRADPVFMAMFPLYAKSFDALDDEMKEALRSEVRAQLRQMREPSEVMVEASNREWDGRMSCRSSGAWRAMIDAALAEPE